MSDYADTVDYYRSGGVPRGAVRQDKLRAFSKYDSVEVTPSNVSVTVDGSGEAAIAEFDKHWLFEGENVYEGRARSQLKFRRINGRWLITSERDLKVY